LVRSPLFYVVVLDKEFAEVTYSTTEVGSFP